MKGLGYLFYKQLPLSSKFLCDALLWMHRLLYSTCIGQGSLFNPRYDEINYEIEGISMTLIEVLLSLFLPPLGVFLAYGISTTLVINIVLTLFGWLPGVLHAFWVISKKS
jgi:uncharacterized membrane protein YqaE (UPF0057 family)